ncbi:hypothetical protein BO86DRAFT_394506 [Aspergillus japonicus CBS 114.51]|uniref:Myb-like DNA-binding domain-containing protein n=1 Tax=Aspergillus japonicus CBS 114.51 TaxID=1448312 RepID=A0A8T8XJB0_ASPJA|nr:hypothetical protein BO86DRAFT_394506 [Aspergillus japonicus CBS 114.51]RAH87739.1 hypothetical protein BO86DRAFT_394506 [Aspergillus japonicus CBS 114.51]
MPDLKRTHEADVLLLYVILLNADSETVSIILTSLPINQHISTYYLSSANAFLYPSYGAINWPAVAEATGITQSAARLKWYRLKQELDLKIQAGGFDYKDMRVAEAQSDGGNDVEGSSMKVISTPVATAATIAVAGGEESQPHAKQNGQQHSQLQEEKKKKEKRPPKTFQDVESVLFSDSSSAGSDGDVDEDDWVDGTRGGRRKSFVFYTGDLEGISGETTGNLVEVLASKRRELRMMASQERVSCWSSDSSLVEVARLFYGSLGDDFAFYSDEDDRGNGGVQEGGKAGDCAAT